MSPGERYGSGNLGEPQGSFLEGSSERGICRGFPIGGAGLGFRVARLALPASTNLRNFAVRAERDQMGVTARVQHLEKSGRTGVWVKLFNFQGVLRCLCFVFRFDSFHPDPLIWLKTQLVFAIRAVATGTRKSSGVAQAHQSPEDEHTPHGNRTQQLVSGTLSWPQRCPTDLHGVLLSFM